MSTQYQGTMMKIALIPAALAASLALSPAALAQSGPPAAPTGDRISQAIVYGEDKCPEASGEEIIVCARLPEGERFRVPQMFRGGDLLSPKNEAWANKVTSLERIGRFGTDSCSPVGLGGFTGCANSLIDAAYAERRAIDKTDWEAMIADERRKRIDGIDAAADMVEAAVVADEKEREERLRREAEIEARGGAPAASDAPLPVPPPR
jgi:hypothetical protein